MSQNYAPQCRDTKWSWKKQGTFELRVTTGHRPPWMDVKTLRAAQASGSTLEWDLRSRPVLWRSVELWAWSGGPKQENPKQTTMFAIDRQDPLSHLDMAEYLGEAKLVFMSADCSDQYGSVDEPTTFNYTLGLWFGVDVDKAFFGQQEEKALQRRKLLWALGERNASWLTLGYVEQEKPLDPQADLDLDDDDDETPTGESAVRELKQAVRDGTVQISVVNGGKDSTAVKVATQIMDMANATGLPPEQVLELAKTAVSPWDLDDKLAAAKADQATLANPKPASNVYELKPKAKPVKRDLVAEMRKLLQPVLDKRADAIAAELQVTEEDVVKAARDDLQFEVRRFRPAATGSLCTFVSLKNLALRPMFEDPETEAERLEACRTDMARHAAAYLAQAHAVYVAEGHVSLIRSGEVDARALADGVAAVMDAGDISAQLYQALMDRPAEFKLVDARGVAVERMSHGLVSPARWNVWVVSPAQPPVVAQEPEPVEQLEVTMPDFDAPEPVEVRMAKMDARILNAMVESLRNASFDRAAHNVAYDCNTSVTCTTDDVLRLAESDPRFATAKHSTGPIRIQLVADPTQDELRATIEGWVHDAVGQRMGKGELALKIQEHWGLRLPSIGRSWLDMAMRSNLRLVDMNAKGIGLASAWGPAQGD